MTDYGVTPTGFARKRLPEILTDIEAGAVTAFGPGVIQTPQSPLGQWNGLAAFLASLGWEMGEDVYQSLDPDQAEGARLDMLARLRLLERVPGELDEDFRAAITNAGRSRIDTADIYRAIRNLSGVTWAHIYSNDDDAADANGIAGHSISVAVIGGSDAEIAQTVRSYVVPGVGTYGNTIISTTIEGFCRSIKIIRPTEIPVKIEVDVIAGADINGCPAPSVLSMAAGLAQALSGDARPVNGQSVTTFLIRQAIESTYPNVQVSAVRASIDPAAVVAAPLAIGFFEIMSVSAERINVIAI
jgi:hypothetical protein